MFRFITKKELWDIEDSGLLDELPKINSWQIKSAQDALAYKYLHPYENKFIAEVGGGNSRVLQALMKKNRCVNIDKLEGQDGGPQVNNLPKQISVLPVYLGKESQEYLESGLFDVLFSISVVEHIADEDIPSFFEENARILKKNSLTVHLIDIYLSEEPEHQSRLSLLSESFFKHFMPLSQDILDPVGVKFSCSYVTNPDPTMNVWNKVAPSLKNIRETHQACTFLLAGRTKL